MRTSRRKVGRKHPEQQYIQMDTSQILFICGGSFVGIEEIIRKRLGSRRIGFAASSETTLSEQAAESGELLAQVTPEDVLGFGLIPELVGRLPIITPLMPLTREAMVKILTEPKNALVRQYQHLFTLENAGLEFTEDALNLLAERAMARKTGARALRAVMDEYMLNIMYELPEREAAGATYIIDANAIENDLGVDELELRKKKESA